MRIANIKIENYKIFKGQHNFDFKDNLIFLVGENNTGKSTLFQAINFVKTGLPKEKKLEDIKNKSAGEQEHVVCTIKFVGKVKEVISDFSEKKYEKYVFTENSEEALLVQRSSEEKFVKQDGKEIKLDIKKVSLWNPTSNQFENPAGPDSVLGTLFDTQFIWADSDPDDVTDFGSTKICGRLLVDSIGNFFEGSQWKKFTDVHEETFHGKDDSLSSRTKKVEQNIKSVLEKQYGLADIKFNFSLPDASTFYKSGEIVVDDGANTKLEEKGTGMQRAVALAIVQVYAQTLINHPDDPKKSKPLFFFIDEPEICLHPKAQRLLLSALITISKIRQIFISTHSPFLLKSYDFDSHDLLMFTKCPQGIKVTSSKALKLFDWSPSWGEINYYSFDLPTIEFHNELYGYLQEKEQKFK
jgi:predicted ATP-dependent endonuclease of OLD family